MTFSKLHPILLAMLAGTTLFFASCDKDNDPNDTNGQLNVEITDGPTEDPNVKAVFVTVAEVKVDGQTFSGFSGKKTISLLAYQQGDVAVLGLGDYDAGTYQNITLVLDAQTDEGGNSPGCYVQTFDNVKHALSATATHSITATKSFVVENGAKTNLVLDFDLRKAIQYQNGGGADQYDFVGSADLQAALRLVVKSEAGNLVGTAQNSILNTDKIVAFVYKKGTFNRAVEIQSVNGVAFKNAVASSEVSSTGEFKVAFLESGDYEIHFAAYKDMNSDDKLDFQGTLILDSLIDLNNLQMAAGANLQLNVTVIGILP
ncbi:MAG: DUF4382 domain-containing protein [Saprospiraceae bacterium]|nr:DUF4382 domain-containing protein [Saprospiraceae bacterium]